MKRPTDADIAEYIGFLEAALAADMKRPTDADIAEYIAFLEAALAAAGAPCPVNARIFAAVHPWAEHVQQESDPS